MNRLVENPSLRDRRNVFRDRAHAGEVLAELVRAADLPHGLVLGIPAGGVPVAIVLAERLGLPLDLAVVSKITLPWNTESGYGAVAFDGSVRLNEDYLSRLPLSDEEVRAGVERTRAKVERRARELRSGAPPLALEGRSVLLVDDGLASGITMRVAIAACRVAGAEKVAVAVPTAHADSIAALADEADRIYCANVRGGYPFAVAEAYRQWSDVSEDEVKAGLAALARARAPSA